MPRPVLPFRPAAARRNAWSRPLRRAGFVAVLLSIFAVGFGGSFTCETKQNHSDHTRPTPPPR